MSRPAALAIAAILVLGSSQSTSPTNTHPAPVKTASQTYKNIQVLKDVPAPDWIPTMEFISGSLGVSCDFCHTIGKFDTDSKETKRTARDMIRMVEAINRDNFAADPVVTCNTCHRGQIRPNAAPAVWNKSAAQLAAYQQALQAVVDRDKPASTAGPAAPQAKASYPAVSTILARYRQAVGAEKMTSWKSLRVAGTATAQAAHGVIKFAVQFVLPDKMLLDGLAGASRLVVSGDRAWAVTPRGRTVLPADETDTVVARARLFAPVKIVKSSSMRTVGLEKVGDRSLYVLEWRVPKVVERAYFDSVSGLLFKTREETVTPLGTMVSETLFEDYRNLDGIKLPYRVVGLFMEDRIEYTITDAQKNSPFDPTLFVAPPAPPR